MEAERRTPGPTAGHVDLGDYLLAPDATLRAARRQGPLAHTGDGGASGMWTVLGYDESRAVLTDLRFREAFVDALEGFGVTSGSFHRWMSLSPLNHDGPDHRRWRALMSRTFTPRQVDGLRPELAAMATDLVRRFASRGECDLVADFADGYPSLGLCALIGVPAEDRDRFREWANTIGLGFNPMLLAGRLDEVDTALDALLDYTAGLVTARQRDPRDDLVSRIATDEDHGYDTDERAAFVAGLVFAGHETTKNQLGWLVATLADQPEVWDAVGSDPSLAPHVVEEALRYRSTVTGVMRRAAGDAEIAGCPFSDGDRVLVSLWSANRDESTFPVPDRFDPVTNDTAPHIGFGHGAHHCIGANLARAELQEALRALTTAIECPTVGDDAEWAPPIGINGPLRLPLTFSAR